MMPGMSSHYPGLLCAHCGRPMLKSVSVAGMSYHEECAHGPDWRPYHELEPFVRGLVRDELLRVALRQKSLTGG